MGQLCCPDAVSRALVLPEMGWFSRALLLETGLEYVCVGIQFVICMCVCDRSLKHLPGFMAAAEEMGQLGVETIACVSVNDAFVMDAWGKAAGVENFLMLADGNAAFAKAMHATIDLQDKGVGIRSRRYSLIAKDGIVRPQNSHLSAHPQWMQDT